MEETQRAPKTLEMSLVGVGTVLHLERDARSMAKR